MTLLQCKHCAAHTLGVPHRTLGRVCALCLEPLQPKRTPNQKKSARKAARKRARKVARAKSRERSVEGFITAHVGNPLGARYPGGPLAWSGESHRNAWYRVLREDPCSYCARPGGTIDHVDPCSGSSPLYGLYSWLNVTGACTSCNGSKGAEKLLLWLAVRGLSS